MIKQYAYSDNIQLTPHFKSGEFRCKCGQNHSYYIDEQLPINLEKLFTVVPQLFGVQVKEIRLTSGYRCPTHDRNVGGSGSGPHTGGFAADYCVYGIDGKPISTKMICCAAQEIGFRGIANIDSNYCYIHTDVKDRTWHGNEFLLGNGSINPFDFWQYFGLSPKEPTPTPTSVVGKGIDISAWQGDVDFARIAPNVDFAIIRSGFGRLASQVDAKYERNYAGFKAQSVPIGAYWYCYADSVEDAEKEAYACLEHLRGKQFELPIFYDILEDDHIPLLKKKGDVATLINQIVPAFCSILEQNKYYVGIYCNTAGYSQYLNDANKKRYVQWCADWRGTCGYTGPKVLWQYSATGSVPGISGNVDLDYSYTDFAIIKNSGYNGWIIDTSGDKPDDTPAPDIPTPDEEANVFEKILKEVQEINRKLGD